MTSEATAVARGFPAPWTCLGLKAPRYVGTGRPQVTAALSAQHREHFRHHPHGDLGGRLRAQVEPDRREDVLQLPRIHAAISQRVEDLTHLAAAADHAEIAHAS